MFQFGAVLTLVSPQSHEPLNILLDQQKEAFSCMTMHVYRPVGLCNKKVSRIGTGLCSLNKKDHNTAVGGHME